MPKAKKSKKKTAKVVKKKVAKAKPKALPKTRGNPHLAKLKRKADALKQHLAKSKEDRQSLVRLKQLETQIGG
ncbi:hypothetical protein J4450_04700 [Candidatus Micrarchaeota archaeon]|nr:hypothetical protein [Candidatus Micrarchaeota archaeon]